jgi:hypothetical protein
VKIPATKATTVIEGHEDKNLLEVLFVGFDPLRALRG